eukprot:TRINITY_DN36185_c0_g1_i1.p2 TRINITY_DN36185_c0_g1~~TRINITY_DN36185_c0_g1_i1.p2  ORF type:complete len:113 (-),score=28.23 TRINITY_DN36185_c0_g1_i1:136-474(-)
MCIRDSDGSETLEVSAGDSVVFRRGVQLTWHVIEPATKQFAYFDESGERVQSDIGVACDECGAECFAESYFIEELEMDICPKCKKAATKAAAKGDGDDMYEGAVLQRNGETV